MVPPPLLVSPLSSRLPLSLSFSPKAVFNGREMKTIALPVCWPSNSSANLTVSQRDRGCERTSVMYTKHSPDSGFLKGVSTRCGVGRGGVELGRLIAHDHLYYLSGQPGEHTDEALRVSNMLDVLPLMETNFYLFFFFFFYASLLCEPTVHPEWQQRSHSQDLVETIKFPLAGLFLCSFPV